ncbi:CRAL/TRIO domain-containing protein [Venturia nashicola]|uniref:CRAL/TRIO domain-containing protein n=1 Tax=Venturia nashicola TaxID=86259 RepID=A0A4Z1P2U9_9PEZI|nr:CRAL/TRIO domain-containing protein [Venturia nashicola]TLD19538.1 CRAL/TRIO domain-containing protein [Venturia nashicola]
MPTPRGIPQRILPIARSRPSGRSLTVRIPYLPLRLSSCPQHQALRSCWRRQFSTGKQRIVCQSSISLTTAVAIAVAVGASVGFAAGFSRAFNHSTTTEPPIPVSPQSPTGEMTVSMPPGRPGNLRPEQEERLRELWQLALQVFGVAEPQTPLSTSPNGKTPILSRTSTGTSAEVDSHAASEKKKKSRLSFLKKPRREEEEYPPETPNGSLSGTSTPSSVSDIANGMKDDKHGMANAFRTALAGTSPADIRTAFWDMVKHDHPDALLLRFLRARKWDVNAALVMAISALHWRAADAKVDSDVIFRGEQGMLELTKSENPADRKEGEDFMQQIRMGKSFLHGVDKEGRPICYVRVRLHKPGEQSEASLERFTVYTIETARMFLRPPVDTATVLFDMTDFGLANMDYTPVKFMIKCFEANYPESLGTVLVHKAPWVFQGVWRVIKGWLDPVVAGKVHFTNNNDDLGQYMDKSTIPKELAGPSSWSYSFQEPIPGENNLMEDEQAKIAFLKERDLLSRQYEDIVTEWIASRSSSSTGKISQTAEASFRQQRDGIAELLRANYWKLDPYVRARTVYDRTGELKTPASSSSGATGVEDLTKRFSQSTLQPQPCAPTRASVESTAQSFATAKESWEDDLD